MTNQLKAVLMIADHSALSGCLKPAINIETETIYWDKINYAALSGGQQTAISWAYSIWTDSQAPAEKGYRDLFDHFGSLDRELQQIILTAFAFRHDTFGVPSKTEQMIKDLLKKM